MWYFIAGLFIGGFIGVLIMCISDEIKAVAKKSDNKEAL